MIVVQLPPGVLPAKAALRSAPLLPGKPQQVVDEPAWLLLSEMLPDGVLAQA